MTSSNPAQPAPDTILPVAPNATVPPADDVLRFLPAGTPIAISPSDNGTLKRLGLPATSTIYNMLATGALVGFKSGKSTYVMTADVVRALMRERMDPPRREVAPNRRRPAA